MFLSAPNRVAATASVKKTCCFVVLRVCVFGEEDGDDELLLEAACRLHLPYYSVIPSFSSHG